MRAPSPGIWHIWRAALILSSLLALCGCQHLQLAASPLPITLNGTSAKRHHADAMIIRPNNYPNASSRPKIITHIDDASTGTEPKNRPIKTAPQLNEHGYVFLLEDWF